MKIERTVQLAVALNLTIFTVTNTEAVIPQPDATPAITVEVHENQTRLSTGQGWKKSSSNGIIPREQRIIEEYSDSPDGTPSALQLCSDFAHERITPEIIASDLNLNVEVQSQALQCIDRLKSVRRISVSTQNNFGFGPETLGSRTSQTFISNSASTDNIHFTAQIKQPGVWPQGSIGGFSLRYGSTNSYGLFRHGKSFLYKGIYWSATASADSYHPNRYLNGGFDKDYQLFGNFPIRRSMLEVARWLSQTEILFILAVEDNNYKESWGRGQWCEDSRLDTDRPGRQQWSGLCDKLGDAIVHSGIALDHFIGTGAIDHNNYATGAVMPGGVYAPHMLYVRGVSSTSHAAAKIAAIAARIAAEITERTGKRPLPAQLKSEMFRRAQPETLVYLNGFSNNPDHLSNRRIMVID